MGITSKWINEKSASAWDVAAWSGEGWGWGVSDLGRSWYSWRASHLIHLMPQDQLPAQKQKQPKTTPDGPLTSNHIFPNHFPMEEEYLNHVNILPRDQGCETRGQRLLLLHSQLRSVSLYPLHRPLLLFKSCVKGPQIDCSGWMSFWQVVFPNTYLRLSEKPFRTHVMPFHTSRPLYVLFQELPPFCPPRLHTRQFLPIVSTQHLICEALPNDQHSLTHTARKGQ